MRDSLQKTSRYWRVLPILGILLIVALAAGPSIAPSSHAEGAPHVYLPGYGPLEGCIDVTVGSTGMFPDGAGVINLDVPGPVLDAWLVWTGTADERKGAVTDPNVSDIMVNGSDVTGVAKDMLPQRGESPAWYSYFADVGPNGYQIVGQGGNSLSLTHWGPLFSSTPEGRGTKRNGASLVVVYDTSPCTRANALYIYESIDFAWWETGDQIGTDVISHMIEPANGDRSGQLYTSIAGIDHTQRDNGLCRGVRFWYEQGTGVPPNNLFEPTWPESIGVNGGAVLADDIWNPVPPCTPNFRAPATALAGGYSENGGDYGSAKLEITVPADTTHVAYQLESETPPAEIDTDPPFRGGESFVWVGSGSPFIIDIPSPDLTVTKTDGVDVADPGDTLTYTIDFANIGDGEGENVVITDTLPDYVTFVSASDGGSEAGGVVTWNLGTLPPGASGSVTLTVEIDSLFPAAGVYDLLNSVSISTPTPGDDPSNNDDTDLTKVTAMPELAVTKTAAPEPVPAGDQLTYTINWSVAGSAPAQDLTLTDEVPEYVTFVSASDGGTEAGGVVTWNLGDQNPGESGFVTMIVQVDTPLPNGMEIPNTAVLSDEGSAIEIPPAEDTAISTVISDHTLHLTKTAEPAVAEKGGLITYTLDWSVTGNEPAPDLTLSDALPFGTQFVSASDGGVFAPPNIVWELGDIQTPDSGSVTLVVRVNESLPNGIDIDNTAILSDSDPGTPPAEDSTTTPVLPTPPPGSIGDDVFIDLNNDGVRDPGEPGIPGVTVNLIDPGADGVCGTADDAVLDTTVTNGNGQYLFEVPPGDYCVVVDETAIPDGLSLGATFTNPHGSITIGENEDYRLADFGYVPVDMALIGDTVWLDSNGDGDQDPGEVGISGVTVNLYEPGADGVCGNADDVLSASTVTDAAGVYHFAVAPGSWCVMVDETTLPAGSTWTLTGGTNPHGPVVVNAGDVYEDADFGYNTDTTLGKIGDLVFFDANRNGVYEPALSEQGIANVTIDLFDAGADGQCGTGDELYVATDTTDGSGEYLFTGLADGTYCVVVTDAHGIIADYVQTYGAPNTNNNGQPSPYRVVISGGNTVLYADFGFADGHILSLIKSDDPDPVDAGELLTYSITYSVSGREPAPDVVLKDTIPPHTTFVSATGGGTESGGVVTWNLGTLNPGDSDTVEVVVRVDSPLVNGTVLRNRIVISDSSGLTVSDIEDTTVRSSYVLTITKTDDPDPVIAGELLTFTLDYTVEGNAPATEVMIEDAVPADTTFVSASDGGIENAGVVTWELGTLLPPASGSVTMVVRVDPGLATGSVINNTAVITGKEGPTDEDSSTTQVIGRPILQVEKTASTPGPVVLNEVYTYELCYENIGGADALNTLLVDELPASVDYVDGTASDGGTYDDGSRTLTWDIGTLAAGAEHCVTFDVKVTRTISDTLLNSAGVIPYRVWSELTVINTATIDASNADPDTAEHELLLSSLVNPVIYKAVDKSTVVGGEEIEYTLSITNDGNAPASDVVVTDELSFYLENVRVTTSQGTASYDATTHTIIVELGELGPGATATITIKASVKEDDEICDITPFTFPNSAVVSFNEGLPRESNVVQVQVTECLPPPEIPEPGTIVLVGTGLIGLAGWARRRRRQNETV